MRLITGHASATHCDIRGKQHEIPLNDTTDGPHLPICDVARSVGRPAGQLSGSQRTVPICNQLRSLVLATGLRVCIDQRAAAAAAAACA